MTRVAIVVEGRTEEEFINEALVPHLEDYTVYGTPILLGGNVNTTRLAADMVRLFASFDSVTSLVDFYGFKGKGAMTVEQLEDHVFAEAQSRTHLELDLGTLFPYIQLHEFEGLLFSDPQAFGSLGGVSCQAVQRLIDIRGQFSSPEDINDHFETAPSRRIVEIVPTYNKIVAGSQLATDIGLETIRSKCRRFDRWVARLETLARSASQP